MRRDEEKKEEAQEERDGEDGDEGSELPLQSFNSIQTRSSCTTRSNNNRAHDPASRGGA